jgi:substrate import-associated zinc metallohydrolase lipoprotein
MKNDLHMKINTIKLLLCLSLGSFLFSCTKEDEDLDVSLIGLGGDTWVKGPVDTWLYDNYVMPYNIEVKYRFDRYELALNRVLVPPMEDKVIPVMEAIQKTWIEPYLQEAGENFIKTLSPKQFVLVGSPQFNTNGTITLGTAEGGLKVVLYKINDFEKSNKEEVKQMLHTIHHEFAHILHQNIMYPEEYKRITTDYTASWNDFSLEEARSRGYITQYARSSPDEDFVEMISLMLIEGKEGFDAIVNSAPEDVIPLLRQKEQIVVRYFEESWNIRIYSLQSKTQSAINNLE